MKKLLLALFITLGSIINAQVYSIQYTHYCQLDTISKEMMRDVPYNTTVMVDYNRSRIVFEDNTNNQYIMDIVYQSDKVQETFFVCSSPIDNSEWKVTMLANNTHNMCIISNNNFVRIYKKSR